MFQPLNFLHRIIPSHLFAGALSADEGEAAGGGSSLVIG